MKFGKNLTHLSIPEWKGYNIDYNDLKKQIRLLTHSSSTDLRPLEASFIENFDHVTLFIKTKYGELNRRLQYFRVILSHIQTSLESCSKAAIATARTSLHEVFYHVVELSIVLKNLSKFILIQKIACKKIFKKLLKYYPDREKSKHLINQLRLYLHSDRTSFVNFNLSPLTLELTSLFEDIKLVHRGLDNPSAMPIQQHIQTDNNRPPSPLLLHSSIRKKHSVTDSLATNDTVSLHNGKSNLVHNSSFADLAKLKNSNSSVVFDVKSLLKKNFNLSFLIADDPNTLNEALLTLNVYSNLEILDQNNLISIIYLQSPKFDHKCPSLIITQPNQSHSAIICYSGGLRQFSYCFLPNDFVQEFLTDPTVLETIPPQFQSNGRIVQTLNCLRYNEFTPKLKIVSKRSRFIFHEGDFEEVVSQSQTSPTGVAPGTGAGTISNSGDNPINPSNTSTASFAKFEDDYLFTLDYNIYTTSSPTLVKSLDLNQYDVQMDRFPFATLSATSNDSSLFNFISNLKTSIAVTDQSEARILHNKYSSPSLRRLPEPLKRIIQQESTFNMYKDLNLYEYMLSCYCNIIPQFEENHYANLLYLNLLKKLEEVSGGGESNAVDGEDKQQLLRRVGSTIGMENWKFGGGGGGGFGAGWGKHGPSFNGGGGGGVDGELGNIGGGAGGGGGGGYDRGRFDGGGGGGGGIHDNSPTTHSSTPHSSKSVFTDPHHRAMISRSHNDYNGDGDYNDAGGGEEEEEDGFMMFDSVDDDSISLFIRPQKRSPFNDYFSNQIVHEDDDHHDRSMFGWFSNKFHKLRYWVRGERGFDEEEEFNDIYGQFLGHESSFGNYYYYNNNREKWYHHHHQNNAYFNGYDSTPGNYDSINEDPSFLARDKYQLEYQYQYEQNFDINLSYIYFALCVISVLSSGIALGIIYTIINSYSDPQGRVWIFNNLGLFITLVSILFFSLVFSFMSINLNFQRFSPTPKSHQLVLWIGLAMVSTCAMTSFIILLSSV